MRQVFLIRMTEYKSMDISSRIVKNMIFNGSSSVLF